jgi:hypothetical protein
VLQFVGFTNLEFLWFSNFLSPWVSLDGTHYVDLWCVYNFKSHFVALCNLGFFENMEIHTLCWNTICQHWHHSIVCQCKRVLHAICTWPKKLTCSPTDLMLFKNGRKSLNNWSTEHWKMVQEVD